MEKPSVEKPFCFCSFQAAFGLDSNHFDAFLKLKADAAHAVSFDGRHSNRFQRLILRPSQPILPSDVVHVDRFDSSFRFTGRIIRGLTDDEGQQEGMALVADVAHAGELVGVDGRQDEDADGLRRRHAPRRQVQERRPALHRLVRPSAARRQVPRHRQQHPPKHPPISTTHTINIDQAGRSKNAGGRANTVDIIHGYIFQPLILAI